MPIDRAGTLRNAEKLVRQGKLDAAIAEYVRLVEDSPRDWNTSNALGDLYVRASQVDKACEQFLRIADHLYEEGFLPKAGAIYKKVLKLKPDHEHALVQSAETHARQGLLADARSNLNMVVGLRRARGDRRGVSEIVVRLGSLDPDDFAARTAAAAAKVELGDTFEAATDLKTLAAELNEKGRHPDALEALRQAALLLPDDDGIRDRLLNVYVAAGDFVRARECATTPDQFKALAATLEAQGHEAASLDALRDAARLLPEDVELRLQLARTFVARGDMAAAGEFLTVEIAGDNPQLLLTALEIQLCSGNVDGALTTVRRLLVESPSRRDEITTLGWNVSARAPEAGYAVVAAAADAAVAQSDWESAAAALEEFVTRVPNHIPALMRLVEICVDGGLEGTLAGAKARLADAYIAIGAGAEARFIAEDLVAREPWERSNIDRFRRALEMLGVADPDGVIAERLSGQLPFTSTEWLASEAFPPEAAAVEPAAQAPVEPLAPEAEAPAAARPGAPGAEAARNAPPASGRYELGTSGFDIESALGDLESMPAPKSEPLVIPPAAHAQRESDEVDLSIVLGDIEGPGASPAGQKAPEADLDGVFASFRDESSKSAGETPEALLKHALVLRQAGRFDESVQALETAARSPRHRFQAATLIGRLYRERDMLPQAIEWFERAAEAHAPSPDDGHLLLYELAVALETAGEIARALNVCLELQAEVGGDYRDLAERVDRLAKVQARG